MGYQEKYQSFVQDFNKSFQLNNSRLLLLRLLEKENGMLQQFNLPALSWNQDFFSKANDFHEGIQQARQVIQNVKGGVMKVMPSATVQGDFDIVRAKEEGELKGYGGPIVPLWLIVVAGGTLAWQGLKTLGKYIENKGKQLDNKFWLEMSKASPAVLEQLGPSLKQLQSQRSDVWTRIESLAGKVGLGGLGIGLVILLVAIFFGKAKQA